MLRILLLASLLAAPAAAEPPERASTLVIYGNDPCPKGDNDEIVVCARRPESERYRIPKKLRGKGDPPSETSWVARTEALEEATRFTRPNSCSPVGTWGQTGCFEEMIARWRAARRADQAANAGVP